MHREQTVEDLRRNEMIVGNRKLNPHQHRFEAANDEKDQRIRDIHQADSLVINRRHPLVHHIKRWAPLCLQRLIDGFEYRSMCHAAILLKTSTNRTSMNRIPLARQPVSEALSDKP